MEGVTKNVDITGLIVSVKRFKHNNDFHEVILELDNSSLDDNKYNLYQTPAKLNFLLLTYNDIKITKNLVVGTKVNITGAILPNIIQYCPYRSRFVYYPFDIKEVK